MRRAFTLIELLTVVAIIAVLAALLVAGLQAPKGYAVRNVCMNNAKQIAAAVLMYSDDHADALGSVAHDFHIYFSYKDAIRTYLAQHGGGTNDQVFRCPADDFDCELEPIQEFFRPDPVKGRGFYHLKATHYSSYFFNGAAGNSAQTRVAEKKLSAAREPSRLALVAETSAAVGLSAHDRRGGKRMNNARNVMSFVDGHVSFIPIYWNGDSGELNMPIQYDPPAGYDYVWFGK